MLNIKVLGIGGTKYFNLINNLKKAIEQLDFDVQIEFLKEVEDFIKYEILEIPALVINEEVITKVGFLNIEEIVFQLVESHQEKLEEELEESPIKKG